MRRLIAAALLLLLPTGWAAAGPRLTPARDPRNMARAFSVRTLDGRTVRYADLRGRPLVLEFWATWSAPSRASLRALSAMQGRYGGRGLIILGLSVDDRPAQEVEAFAGRLRLLFPVGMATEDILDDYGPIRSLPTAVLIDRKGRIVRRIVGHLDTETLQEFIREIL